ncbi:MAG: multidrug ABC transporter ATP-binding protein [Saprospiraceae bacterium]|nr:MAG: multidrug ABC transporter ATP-binding protein [Saprospiraceae bacterium]
MSQLIISNISKTYKNGVKALDAISLDVPVGMFGLLGPNGAGKSTLMRTLATLQEADEGTIRLGDLDLLTQKGEVRKRLGYLPQEFGLYPRIPAEVLLDHLAVLKGITNKKERRELVKALLYKTNLYEDRKKRLGGYSGGMKQRFGIAQALLAQPKLLIVDEPTAGLDPVERNRFHNLLSELGNNCIIILSTHIVEDVKELCPNMAIINKGKVLLQGNPLKLIEQMQGKVYKKNIAKNELDHYKQQYRVIADRLLLGKPIIHIYSESTPGNGFIPVEAALDDVYFSQIFGDNL